MEQNNIRKHINSFVFQSYINNQSLAKNKSKAIVEKEYYFDLFFTVAKILYPTFAAPAPTNNFLNVVINGNEQSPRKTFWDFLTLVNFLTQSLRKISIVMGYTIKKISEQEKEIVCTLYYNSLVTKQSEIIQISLIGPSPKQEYSSDDSDVTSGGTSAKMVSQDEIDKKDYEEMFKLLANPKLKLVSSTDKNKSLSITENDVKILNVASSIIKNTPESYRSNDDLSKKVQTTFAEPTKEKIDKSFSNPAVGAELNKLNEQPTQENSNSKKTNSQTGQYQSPPNEPENIISATEKDLSTTSQKSGNTVAKKHGVGHK